eukprot:TRINITY_DN1395_c0_g1_i1.p2 TRINITY_DN1395_c0_g1~~TRINITY_DN1395_c0_g1_i1.p2  ORF type:complete len:339 (+),score=140.40 TRINITY_DN1395_c0_g1_i1:70-1086(+)
MEDYVFGIVVGVTLGFPLVLYILMLPFSFYVVEQKTSMVIERWGKFHHKCEPGIYFLWPFIERIRPLLWRYAETYLDSQGNQTSKLFEVCLERIDLRENALDFPNQTIITRDNVEIQVHPFLLYKIADPVRAVYEVYDLSHALEKLVQTTLRSIIGDMGLDDTLASREEINRTLLSKLSHVCKQWGVDITAVEVLEILPSKSIQEAMHKQLAAERIRRAAIVTAEGLREQAKTEAEGECQSKIAISKGEQKVTVLATKGTADARVSLARAEAQALQIVSEALREYGIDATQYMIGLKYIEALLELALNAQQREILFPFETDTMGSMSILRKDPEEVKA